MEAAQMSIDRWMDKEDVKYMHTMEYYSARKKWNIAICNNMDGTREYNAKQNM